MVRARTGVILIAMCAGGVAAAQSAPQDPYATPAGKDPVLAEQIAEQLVARAQELLEAKIYVDAKQLAVEALVESPKGNAAERARFIIKQVNEKLGIKDEPVAGPPVPVEPKPTLPPVDTSPIEDPTQRQATPPPAETPQPEGGAHDGKLAAMVHGGIYAGMLGTAIGGYFDSSNAAAGAVPTGIAFAAAGALLAPKITTKLGWDEAQIRTAGSGAMWGGAFGGFFFEAVAGANTDSRVHASTVLLGMGLGSSLGLLGGASYANQHKFTRGDVALIDTFTGMGIAGGLSLGLVMQPAQKEGYSLNAALGSVGGVIAGIVVAPTTNTTPRRMVRVAGLATAAGGVPYILLAFKPHSEGLQRTTGALSVAGLVGGAWLGFYLTRHMDEGLDVQDHKIDDAPVTGPAAPESTSMTNTRAFTMPVAFGRF